MQNTYVERKSGSLRRELLNAYLFDSLREVRIMCEEWRIFYNSQRPHKALKYLTPLKYAQQYYQCLDDDQILYPQMTNGNPSKIEGSRLVDKILEKPSPEKSKTPVSN
jgi:hypothetical protein